MRRLVGGPHHGCLRELPVYVQAWEGQETVAFHGIDGQVAVVDLRGAYVLVPGSDTMAWMEAPAAS